MTRFRSDIPPNLLAEAERLGPSVLAALLASYPTDEDHAREVRRRQRREQQLQLPHTNRSAA
jgi:hypothetical protein